MNSDDVIYANRVNVSVNDYEAIFTFISTMPKPDFGKENEVITPISEMDQMEIAKKVVFMPRVQLNGLYEFLGKLLKYNEENRKS